MLAAALTNRRLVLVVVPRPLLGHHGAAGYGLGITTKYVRGKYKSGLLWDMNP
jgi:hypothetical protein